MYNTPVQFDGDIIITDPCYIMNHDNDDPTPIPAWWDFLSKAAGETFDGTTRYNYPKPEDYPDCREATAADFPEDSASGIVFLLNQLSGKKTLISETLKAEEKAYHAAQQAYYALPHDDWDRCGCGENMEALGLKTFLCDSTIYGDWSCTVFDQDSRTKIGEFCADSGQVAVFLLDEVLAYNPKFNYHIERKWTTALIQDFHGTVELHCDGDEVTVVGKGNINFVGKQTGF